MLKKSVGCSVPLWLWEELVQRNLLERGTTKPREFSVERDAMEPSTDIFFLWCQQSHLRSKGLFWEKQEHMLDPVEELAGITTLIFRGSRSCKASLTTKWSIKVSSYFSSDFSGKLLEPADFMGNGSENSTPQKSYKSKQPPLDPCLDCSAPTQRLRKEKENKRGR